MAMADAPAAEWMGRLSAGGCSMRSGGEVRGASAMRHSQLQRSTLAVVIDNLSMNINDEEEYRSERKAACLAKSQQCLKR